MPRKVSKLTLNDYIIYLTNRANRYSYYMIASATLAIPLFALLYVLWGIRLNLFSIYYSIRNTEGSESLIKSMEESIVNLRTTEEFLLSIAIVCVAFFVTFLVISIYENYKLEKFMRKDGPINLEELKKYFKIKRR